MQHAIDTLPTEIDAYLDNVAIIVEREPSANDRASSGIADDDELFGLYVGVPLAEREDYHTTLPDRIVIYQGPLERRFSPREIPDQVARTVLHEIAHHFGMDDRQVEAIGLG